MKEIKPTTAVYLIKPKYIFKTPFLKYDLQNPTNREAQNEELTEYFNYGFNEDTMNIYVKLVNRMLKVLDHKKNLEYFDEPSQLMRLNDEIPMDLGGFGKFYDPEVFKNDFIQNDQQLLKNFLFNIVSASCFTGGKQYPTYPMLEFVKSMYPPKKTEPDLEVKHEISQPNPLTEMVAQITRNLEKKYEETMKKLIEQKNIPKEIYPSTAPFKKGAKFQRRPYNEVKTQDKPKKQEKQEKKEVSKKKDKRQPSYRSSSSSDSSSSGTSSNSSSSSDSEDERRKKQRDRKQKDSRKDIKKERRSKSKSKSKGKRDRDRKGPKKQSRHDSRHEPRHERRDSKNDDRHREKRRSEHHRSRSRDHKSHRRQ